MRTSATRTNEEWLAALRASGPEYEAAVADLREALRRAALFYLRRHRAELSELADDEIDALAEDSGQEACVSVLGKLDSFRGKAHLLTWASKFAVGNALVAFRKRQWRDLSLDRLPDGWQHPAERMISTAGWEHPELAASRNDVWQVPLGGGAAPGAAGRPGGAAAAGVRGPEAGLRLARPPERLVALGGVAAGRLLPGRGALPVS